MKIALLSLLLSGCAICQNHPVACMAGSAFVAGSIAVSLNHQDRRETPEVRRSHLNDQL